MPRPRRTKRLAQLKIDARNAGWPKAWSLDHPNDERALIDGCYPDIHAAERLKRFYERFMILPNEGGGTKPFTILEWWYRDVLGPLFGWKRKDGRRRFDKGFVSTAKKSAKSTLLAGLPLYMMLADGEDEAEAYVAAVDRDQASIIYRKTSRAVKLSPLAKVLKRIDSQKRIVHASSSSFFEAISSDADSAEGANPHLLLVDELHAWRDRQFFNALMYGDIARNQPMFLMITTAGDDKLSIGYEEYEFAKALLDPGNDFYSMSHFAFIAEAAPEREWDDPAGWKEANPSIGKGYRLPTIAKLKAKCDEARQSPRKQRQFIRYICNRWVDEVEAPWLDVDGWRECSEQEQPDHHGTATNCGIDLSRTRDMTALCMVWRVGVYYDAAWRFWFPADNLKRYEDEWRVPLRDWAKAGWILTTPGRSVDYGAIRRELSGAVLDDQGNKTGEHYDGCLADAYNIQAVGYDPYNSLELIKNLREYDGINTVEVPQNYTHLNAPCKLLETLIADRHFRPEPNPVATWMAGHCVAPADPNGNIKPSKNKSKHKIDGITALVIAMSRARLATPPKRRRILAI